MSASDATHILRAISQGNREAYGDLLPLVYEELHSRAAELMRRERADHTLQATALVNEAYLALIDQRRVQWRDKLHFFAVSARIMRRILADHARKAACKKRGDGWERVTLDQVTSDSWGNGALDLGALDVALQKLEAADGKRAQVVEMRFFGGMSEKQIAEVMNVSVRTVERHWRSARAWLFCELQGRPQE